MTRLFHISDIHFGAEDREALDWFSRTVHDERPDAVIVTGDLTMRARRREFEAAAEWLIALDRPMTVEVGNHDLPYFNPLARLFGPYRRYRAVERMIERPLEIAGVAIVPLKTTARFQWRLNWSKGHVSRGSLERALGMIDDAPDGDVLLIAAHHPLVEPGTHATSRTRNGRQALRALAEAGADAVLTGHVHDPFDIGHPAGDRDVRLIGAGTLSERTRVSRPSFNQIDVVERRIGVTCRTM